MVEGPFQKLKFGQNKLNDLALYFIGSP
jgi:hypothetical protein